MDAWLLGVDPGRTGAAVASRGPAGHAPQVVWVWRPRTRNKEPVYEVCVAQMHPVHGLLVRLEIVKTLHDVGVLVRDGMVRVTSGAPWRVWSENAHISFKNPKAGLSVAMTTGKLVGPMESLTGAVKLVEPAEWRSEVLDLHPRTSRDRAKRISLRELPRRLPHLSELLDAVVRAQRSDKKKMDHITDAAGITEYGHRRGQEARDDDDGEE